MTAMRAGDQSADQALRVHFLPFYRSATTSTHMDGLELIYFGSIHQITRFDLICAWMRNSEPEGDGPRAITSRQE